MTGIYKIESKLYAERIYIGSTINFKARWNDHFNRLKANKHDNKKLQNHVNKYGLADLIFIVIEPCLLPFLLIREQYYIDKLNPYFNICKIAGSTLGRKMSKESRAKMRLRPITKGFKGRKHSPETLIKMSKSAKETSAIKHILDKNQKGENHPWYGRHHSEETKQKIREKSIKQFSNPENRRKVGEKQSWLGKKHSEETKKKMSISNKKAWVLRRVKKIA